MHLGRQNTATPEAVLAAPGAVAGAGERRDDRKRRVAVSDPDGAVRADLEDIFRRDYQCVVGVAARVLGSRDQAEDVAQDVFLSFGRSGVPAGRLAAGSPSPPPTPR